MQNIKYLLLLSFVTTFANLNAQEVSYGIKAGLNFNSLIADEEQGADGMSLENFDGRTGFHVGATFDWEITDLMGLRWEVLFSQKGYKRRYNGPSYFQFTSTTDNRIVSLGGNRNQFLSVANSYIDIPITGYAKLARWLEVHIGANVGILVNSTAVGSLRYNVPNTNTTIEYDLDYRYGRDEAGEFVANDEPVNVSISGNTFATPQSAGAYFEYEEKPANYHNLLDIGLVGGFSVYLNQGLYLMFRGNYGLRDVTDNSIDYSLNQLDENNGLVETNDQDQNLSIQVSVGFSF